MGIPACLAGQSRGGVSQHALQVSPGRVWSWGVGSPIFRGGVVSNFLGVSNFSGVSNFGGVVEGG